MLRFVAIILFAVISLPLSSEAASPIKSQLNGKCIDVPGGQMKAGVALIMWDCHGGGNQQFDVTATGELKIGGLCVDAFGGGGRAGDRIGLWTCHGGANQKWRLEGNALKGINNRCIDIARGNAANGATLLLWNCHGDANQKWHLAGNPPTPQAKYVVPQVAPVCDPNGVRYDTDAIGTRERCFGATGNGCLSQMNKAIPNDSFKKAGKDSDCTTTVGVTVGSILHDNCCLELKDQGRAKEGHMCTKEWYTPEEVSTAFDAAIGALYNDGKACAREWRKATYDVIENRFWYEKFGPYLTHDQEDDLGKVNNPRWTMLPGRLGVLDNPVRSTTGERMQSRRLQAPSGTKLEFHDVQFCRSGRFRDQGWCQGPDCSNPANLAEAKKWLSDWEDWKRRRQQDMTNYENSLQGDIDAWDRWAREKHEEGERLEWWDLRKAAIATEISVAQADRAARVTKLGTAKAAHGAEMSAAELGDGATRRTFLARRQQIYDARTSHWGICE